MRKFCFALSVIVIASPCMAQNDSLDNEQLAKAVSLSEVVIRSDLNVASFIKHIKEDSTYHKAFRNLHILGYTALNDIRINDKQGKQKASLQGKTRQFRKGNCRYMTVLEEKTTGDFYDNSHDYNYYTAQLYASFLFTKDTICGENNIVKTRLFSLRSKKGLEKNKEQLRMLFFNPGKKIPGIPFMGDKMGIFDPDKINLYDFSIDQANYEGTACYIFTVTAKEGLSSGKKDQIVIDKMATWFNAKTLEVMSRNYSMSYSAGVYDFDVQMEVALTHFQDYLVPKLIRYNGNWDAVFKKRERGTFTATLYNFEK